VPHTAADSDYHDKIVVNIPIPAPCGKMVAGTVPLTVSARYVEEYKDYLLNGRALEQMDTEKARVLAVLMENS
jgi:hypothetical protein